MTSLTTLLLLPISLLALYHSTTTTEARAASQDKETMALHKRSAPLPNLVEMMRRRKSFEAALRGPPSLYQNEYAPGVQKREDEWIWMPAHGYIPMPKDESYNEEDSQDNGIGNLLRYG